MIKLLFAVRDSASQVFAPPFLAPAEGFAMRLFKDAVLDRDKDNQMAKHPEDFELYLIGEYSEDVGLVKPLEIPRLVLRGKDCLALQ